MKTWPIEEPSTQLGELLEACLSGGAQVLTQRGLETAVLVLVKDWPLRQRPASIGLKRATFDRPNGAGSPYPAEMVHRVALASLAASGIQIHAVHQIVTQRLSSESSSSACVSSAGGTDPTAGEVEAGWNAEIERRLAAHDRGDSSAIDAENVFERAREIAR